MVVSQSAGIRVNMKRKCFAKGKGQAAKRFKRYKKTPNYIKNNIENQIAREKEKEKNVFDFSDSEEDRANELGMGLDIADLAMLSDDVLDKEKQLIALSQDSVRPFFANESEFDPKVLNEALVDLRYTSFRHNQEETIKRILFGRSTLFISPTGSGKSLCYQIPALLYWRYKRYMTIVVSPLISLMEDQILNFPPAMKAVSIHSGHTLQQRRNTIQQLSQGEAQVVFLSPEAIVGGILDLEDLKSLPPIGFVCIDEAHCLSEWSHNFRPAYLQFFKVLSDQLKIKTFLGLTATSSRATSFAISKCLTINPESDVIGATKVPENLLLSVSHENNKELALINLLQTPTFLKSTSIIVYCNTRVETENVASIIRTRMQNYTSIIATPKRIKRKKTSGDSTQQSEDVSSEVDTMKLPWNAEAYHAGLTTCTRKKIQKDFITGKTRVVVATIAFGMGINKANIRAVIHYDMPGSFESYVQEIGRAGRDGFPAQCHMFLRSDMTDVFYQQRNIYSSVVERQNISKLVDMIFKSCRCLRVAQQAQLEKLEKMNQNDPHEVSSWQQTEFTSIPVECSEEDLEADESFESTGSPKHRSGKPMKYIHKSIVSKHRICSGHEIAFSITGAAEEVNLSPESIITFICQIQQAYPQLKIRQFTPLRSRCHIFCYKGHEQMEKLRRSCPVVNLAYLQEKMKAGKTFNNPNKISFELTDVTNNLQMSTDEARKMLRHTEWELVEETGRFRKSQISVKFDGNSFHLSTVFDLRLEEKSEIQQFLVDYMQKYETISRNKVIKMYNTFKEHSIGVDQMRDKIMRLQTSMKLKKALDDYFNPTTDQFITNEATSHKELDISVQEVPDAKREAIVKSAREFISGNGTQHTPRAIAKIFQGVSCPNYPVEHWGQTRRFWRIHPDVDFLKLQSIIQREWMLMASRSIALDKRALVCVK